MMCWAPQYYLLLLGVSVPMPDPWLTFAPLQPAWIVPTEINLSYHFSDQVSLRPIPEWIRQADTVDELRPQLCEKIETDGTRPLYRSRISSRCIRVARSQLERRPPWSMQDTAAQWIRSVHLALWLARPTSLAFNYCDRMQ